MSNAQFKNFTAIMIAVVTIVSAIAAWRAAVASSEAGQSDFAGLAAAINAEESQVLNTIAVNEHYQAFLAYTRYNSLADNLADAIQKTPNADDPAAEALDRAESESSGLAFGIQSMFFPSRYLRPEGTYDYQREMDEKNADAERERDIKPELHFSRADGMRVKSNLLIGSLILLGMALWMFTCAQIIERRIKYFFAAGGMLLLGSSVLGIGLVELLM